MVTMFNAGCSNNIAGGGGATDGIGIQSFPIIQLMKIQFQLVFWSDYYRGIYRANLLLEKLQCRYGCYLKSSI